MSPFLFREILLQVQALITQTEIKDLQLLAKSVDKQFLFSGIMVITIGLIPRHGRVKQDDFSFYHTKFREQAKKHKQQCSLRIPWPWNLGKLQGWSLNVIVASKHDHLLLYVCDLHSGR